MLIVHRWVGSWLDVVLVNWQLLVSISVTSTSGARPKPVGQFISSVEPLFRRFRRCAKRHQQNFRTSMMFVRFAIKRCHRQRSPDASTISMASAFGNGYMCKIRSVQYLMNRTNLDRNLLISFCSVRCAMKLWLIKTWRLKWTKLMKSPNRKSSSSFFNSRYQ